MLNLDAGKDKAIVLEAAADSTNELSAINQFVVFPEQQTATFEETIKSKRHLVFHAFRVLLA